MGPFSTNQLSSEHSDTNIIIFSDLNQVETDFVWGLSLSQQWTVMRAHKTVSSEKGQSQQENTADNYDKIDLVMCKNTVLMYYYFILTCLILLMDFHPSTHTQETNWTGLFEAKSL